jgi:hypothetical protein
LEKYRRQFVTSISEERCRRSERRADSSKFVAAFFIDRLLVPGQDAVSSLQKNFIMQSRRGTFRIARCNRPIHLAKNCLVHRD